MARFKRRFKKAFKKKHKGFYKKNYKLVTFPRVDKRLHTCMPPRLRTYLFCNLSGSVSAGNVTSTTKVVIPGNSMKAPFGSLPGGYTAVGALAGSVFTPNGYLNFMTNAATNGFYGRYRVFASKITVTFSPSVTTDTLGLVIVPRSNNGILDYGNYQTASQGPYSKGPIMCTGNNNIRQNTLSNYASSAEILGLTRAAVQTESDTAATVAADPTKLWNWEIWAACLDNTASGTIIYWDIRMKYYVEFFDLAGPSLLDINNA